VPGRYSLFQCQRVPVPVRQKIEASQQ
jgi:hypothetical protein